MKQFASFVKKEFLHIFRDPRTMLLLLGMPIAQIILFGFALTTEVKNVRVAVLDPTPGEVTRRLAERIDASSDLEVVLYLHDEAQVEPVFLEDLADVVVSFAPRFNDNFLHRGQSDVRLITDASDPNTGTSRAAYIAQVVAAAAREEAGSATPPLTIPSRVSYLFNPGMKAAYNFVPGVMGLILMLICAMMTSISIVREKETGTMEVLLVSPVRPLRIILAKAIPYFTLSCVNLATILLLSVFVLGVPVSGSLFWLLALSFVFILVALALGLLISTLTATQVAAMLASGVILLMPVMLLSGMIFPVESMPGILQGISCIIPARWYIAGVKKLMIEGVSVAFVWKEFLILGGMAIFLLTVSIKNFKNRLE